MTDQNVQGQAAQTNTGTADSTADQNAQGVFEAANATETPTETKAETPVKGKEGGEAAEGQATDSEKGVFESAGEGEKPAEEGEGSQEDSIPEKYDEFNVPEGFGINETIAEKFIPLAKDLKLNQEQAQKVVDLGAELVQQNLKFQSDSFTQQVKAWAKESVEDPDIGGTPENLRKSRVLADKGLRAVNIPGLAEHLQVTGEVHNPKVLKLLKFIGEKISEDTFEQGSRSGGQKPLKTRVYPNSQHAD